MESHKKSPVWYEDPGGRIWKFGPLSVAVGLKLDEAGCLLESLVSLFLHQADWER